LAHSWGENLHCTALHCTALHCTAPCDYPDGERDEDVGEEDVDPDLRLQRVHEAEELGRRHLARRGEGRGGGDGITEFHGFHEFLNFLSFPNFLNFLEFPGMLHDSGNPLIPNKARQFWVEQEEKQEEQEEQENGILRFRYADQSP
jgi:hypothetical protein